MINLDNHYFNGEYATLWTYSPVTERFNAHPEYTKVPWSTDSGKLLLALRWLNVGYFFLPHGRDPNLEPDIKPILIEEKQLNTLGLTNYFFLNGNTLKQACLDSRDTTKKLLVADKIQKAAPKRGTAKVQASPLEKLIFRLQNDKVPKSEINSLNWKILQTKCTLLGYNLREEENLVWID